MQPQFGDDWPQKLHCTEKIIKVSVDNVILHFAEAED